MLQEDLVACLSPLLPPERTHGLVPWLEGKPGKEGVATAQCSHAGLGEASGHTGASSILCVTWEDEVFPCNGHQCSILEGDLAYPDCWGSHWGAIKDCAVSPGQDRGNQKDLYHREPHPCLLGARVSLGGEGKLCRVLSTHTAPRMLWSCHGPMDGEEGAVLGAGLGMRAISQQGRRGLWEAPHLPGLTQALAFCRTLIYAQGFGASRAAEEALHQRRGCLPGGCPRASTELPGCASPALASLGSMTDTNGSRQAGSSGKDQTPGARGCCQCKMGCSEPSREWQPHCSPCLVTPLLKCCVPTWLQRGAAGRAWAGACRGGCSRRLHAAGAGHGSGPCHGERIRGVPCPGFQIWGDVQATARVQE